MPCSQWDASRPRSEDVRVIGPLLRFRLPRPRGTRFGGDLTGPTSSRYSGSARPGVGGELLITDSPAGAPLHPFIPLFSVAQARKSLLAVQPSPCARYTCCPPRIIRPSFPLGRPQLRHRRRRRDSDSLSSRKLPIDHPFFKLDKSLL